MSRGSRRTRRAVWAGYTLLLAAMTHLPKAELERMPIQVWDKLSHGAAYAVLAYLTWRAFAPQRASADAIGHGAGANAAGDGHLSIRLAGWLAALLMFAAADEWTQPLVGRSAELSDWAADGVGAAFGLLVGMWRENWQAA